MKNTLTPINLKGKISYISSVQTKYGTSKLIYFVNGNITYKTLSASEAAFNMQENDVIELSGVVDAADDFNAIKIKSPKFKKTLKNSLTTRNGVL